MKDLNQRRPAPRFTDAPPLPEVERDNLTRLEPALALKPLLLTPNLNGPTFLDLR